MNSSRGHFICEKYRGDGGDATCVERGGWRFISDGNMCFCRRRTSSKEDVDSSRIADNSKRKKREQPLPQVANGGQVAVSQKVQKIVEEPKEEEKEKPPKPKPAKSAPKAKKTVKRRAAEDDTVSNIPDEMPDLEINREHPEPFYTDEQLM